MSDWKAKPDGHGTLNWMIAWQSADGRPMVVFYESGDQLTGRYDNLQSLGRKPMVYRLMQKEAASDEDETHWTEKHGTPDGGGG